MSSRRVKNQPYDEIYELDASVNHGDTDALSDEEDDYNNVNSNNNDASKSEVNDQINYDMDDDDNGPADDVEFTRFGGQQDDEDDEHGAGKQHDDDEEDLDDYSAGLKSASSVKGNKSSLSTEGPKTWLSEFKDLLTQAQSAPFEPMNIELENRLKFFIPDYVPSIGDNDAFLKIPRPDGVDDGVGLLMLDEPIMEQSDPSILMLKLRSLSKSSHMPSTNSKYLSKSIPFGTLISNPKGVQTWIRDIENLHAEQPAASVTYSKPMPELEELIQSWPNVVENALEDSADDLFARLGRHLQAVPKRSLHGANASSESLLQNEAVGSSGSLERTKGSYFNTAALDPSASWLSDLKTMAKLSCLLVDIPVHDVNEDKSVRSRALIESLHLLFNLYSKFQESQHFGTGNDDLQVQGGVVGGGQEESLVIDC